MPPGPEWSGGRVAPDPRPTSDGDPGETPMRSVWPCDFLDRLATNARPGEPVGDKVVPFARPTLGW